MRFIRFLFIGPQSTTRSVTLTQLRFTSFAVVNLQRDLHPQEICKSSGQSTFRQTFHHLSGLARPGRHMAEPTDIITGRIKGMDHKFTTA